MPPPSLYQVLDVPRECDEGELKKAYHKLAKKWHPDKNNACPQAHNRFAEVTGAYEVLSDPSKRALYDECGDYTGAESLFEKLFRYVDESSLTRSEVDRAKGLLDTMFGANDGSSRKHRLSSSDGNWNSPDCQDRKRLRSNPIHMDLELSLEELYHGCRKRLRVGSSKDPRAASFFSFDVQPGWHDGTRVTFAGKGDLPRAVSGSDDLGVGRPRDLVITIKQKPHPRFSRRGNDLVTTIDVPLATALGGGEVSIRTLSQKTYYVRAPVDPRSDGCVILPGEGMPDISGSRNGEAAGDLRVHLNVTLPMLSNRQRGRMGAYLQQHDGSLDHASRFYGYGTEAHRRQWSGRHSISGGSTTSRASDVTSTGDRKQR